MQTNTELQWVEACVAAPAAALGKALTVQLPGGARVEAGDVYQEF